MSKDFNCLHHHSAKKHVKIIQHNLGLKSFVISIATKSWSYRRSVTSWFCCYWYDKTLPTKLSKPNPLHQSLWTNSLNWITFQLIPKPNFWLPGTNFLFLQSNYLHYLLPKPNLWWPGTNFLFPQSNYLHSLLPKPNFQNQIPSITTPLVLMLRPHLYSVPPCDSPNVSNGTDLGHNYHPSSDLRWPPRRPARNRVSPSRAGTIHLQHQTWAFFSTFKMSLVMADFNSLAPGRFDYSHKLVNFKLISTIYILSIWSLVNIGLGNGLVLSGSKPLPEPVLTWSYVAIWRHLATMG